MVGIIWLCAFVAEGEVIARRAFGRHALMTRAWLGAVIGLVMAMWLPTLCAFAMRFTVAAQWTALGLGAAIAAAVYLGLKPRRVLPGDDAPPWLATLAVVLPLLIVGAYLQYTHNLRPVDGAYYVGQSTYSDINLHMSIVTGLRNASFPAEYILLPGTRLCYPFLVDAMSSSMYMLGTDLSVSLWLPGIVMMALTFLGYACLVWRIGHKAWMVVLCTLLLFVNGGFGFFDMFDMVLRDPSRFINIFTGYYQTPTNLPDLNLRWSNILVDMLVPQRTFLAGWTVLMPALYLLLGATRSQRRLEFVATGLLAGCMLMINTHAFLALGLASAGFMFWQLWQATREVKQAGARADEARARRRKLLVNYLIYGGIAVVMALPQVLIWTINQASEGGFLKFHFNWVNNDGGLIDEYFWFWIKNIGPVALFIIPALLDSRGEQRKIAVGAFTIFAVAEFIVFQPNIYDNNKLHYVWYLLMLPVTVRYLERLWQALRAAKLRGIALLMAGFMCCAFVSGTLTIAREWISNYQLYSATEVSAMEYVDDNALDDAVFLTGGQHNNAVASLAGRKLVCGSGTFLYFHGLNYAQQESDAASMFTDPVGNAALFEQYGVDYIYISNQERSQYALDESLIASLYPLWYSLGDINIYAVSERAQAAMG